jgi:hypothetical protein
MGVREIFQAVAELSAAGRQYTDPRGGALRS